METAEPDPSGTVGSQLSTERSLHRGRLCPCPGVNRNSTAATQPENQGKFMGKTPQRGRSVPGDG